MAAGLGEPVGQSIGYRIRGEAKVSGATRIEVVTEGILTRMLQSDPDLPGIGAVIFDEFHERSLNADLGLALCLEVAGALRDDLILLAMSATLDAGPVGALMGAQVLTSEGRSYPVETIWAERPLGAGARMEPALCDLVLRAEEETRGTGGGLLVFLPGEAEIRRVEAGLRARLPGDCVLRPLYGAMPFAEQRAAIAPLEGVGRKVVLSTSIAETSLTIEDIRVVVDAGLARRARFDPGSGMSRLITERASRAEATQRQGRAGRVAAGRCYRLWTKGEHGALPGFPPAEIEVADLAGLALDLALWGSDDLPFLTPPPAPALAEARALLRMLGALDARDRITAHGKALAALPLHPRLGHMLARVGPAAAPLAALIAERDPLRGAPAVLGLRLEALRDPARFARERPHRVDRGTLARIGTESRRLARQVRAPGRDAGASPAQMAALAYPDRIGKRRAGEAPRYVLTGGKGAVLRADDPLAASPLLVALDTDGDRREARIRLAAPIRESELREIFADDLVWSDICEWSRRERRVVARRQLCLGAIALEDRIWQDAPQEAVARAMLEGVREIGLAPSPAAARFIARVELARGAGEALPDMSPEALMADLEVWLLPMLGSVRSAAEWQRFDILPALQARLNWEQGQAVERLAPAHFTTPLGRRVAITYGDDGPEVALRLQELFGVKEHPTSAGQPLKITLLSPAQRPVQVTRDLPGFWAGSYADVRKDMRARYPKHPWPEDPTEADPTLRAKRRDT
jgi:ATP-dependent helicase HrpB